MVAIMPGMLLKKFGFEDVMANYAIATVPRRRPFRHRFLANLSPPFPGTGDVRGRFTDDVENAVLINRRNVALYLRYELTLMQPDMDFMIIDMREYEKYGK